MSTALRVERLQGGYGKLQVLRDIDLTLAPGETLGVLGVNGAGKTTLLRTMAGLLPSLSGRIMLGDLDVTGWPTFRRARAGLALVPEGRLILGTLTVRDNLELTRAVVTRGANAAGFDARLAETFDLFPRLVERLDQLGGTLSGGEQQMLAIARALMMNPSVLMLDEPTQGLAPIVLKILTEAFRKIKGRFAIILVEQNQSFLEGVVDRIFMMRAGRLEPAYPRIDPI